MTKIEERRKRYLVNRRLQLQLSYLLMIQIIPIMILGAFIYSLNKMYLTTLQSIVGETVLPAFDIQGILNFFIITLVSFLIIAAVLLAFMGIRFSHRIAGPLYRLEDSMEKLARGEKVKPIQFRKSDAVNVTSLVDKFNVMLEKLNERGR